MKGTITTKEIRRIHNFVIKILRQSGGNKRSLKDLSEDNCSELSRLAGCFVLESYSGIAVYVLKGDKVFGKKKSHDIVAIQKDNRVCILDPSVWQFFPRKRSIFVSDEKNFQDSLKTAKKIYDGTWKVSEKLSLRKCQKEKGNWLAVIKRNNTL